MSARRFGAAALWCLVPVSLAAAQQPSLLHLGDIDADGLDDALVIGPAGEVRLLANRGEGRFEDVTTTSGLERVDFASCALFADFDGDGHVDLFVGSSEQRLWRNDGKGVFTATPSGVEHDLVDLEARALDHDHDGRLDLVLHTEAGDLLYRNTPTGHFERVELPEANHPATSLSLDSDDGAEDDAANSAATVSAARKRYRRWLRLRASQAASNAAGASNTSNLASNPNLSATSTGPQGLAGAPTMICAGTIVDQATGSCVQASSVGVLGELYPLSTTFFVDSANQRVGIGTAFPQYKLHVAGQIVSGSNSIASGLRSAVGGGGGNSATANYATVGGGYNNEATAYSSVVCGGGDLGSYGNRANGPHSAIVGGGNQHAAGASSFIGGGDSNLAYGFATTICGGWLNEASGSYATIAGGNDNNCSGAYSFAVGEGIDAESRSVSALGRYNLGGGNATTWVATDPLFEIGNGTSDIARSNALTVLKNGNVGIGVTAPAYRLDVDSPAANSLGIRSRADTTGLQSFAEASSGVTYGVWGGTSSPSGFAGYFTGPSGSANYFQRKVGIGASAPAVQLHIEGGSDTAPTGGGYAQFGPSSGQNVSIDSNEIMARNNGVTAGLSINADGGNLYFSQNGVGRMGILTDSPAFDLHVNGTAGKPGGGSWSVASDARLKKNVNDLDGALERLLALRGVTYEYIDPASIGEREGERIGFIAQEVERVFPDWVGEKDDGTKYVSVSGFEALTVEALRELGAEKERQLAALHAENASRAAQAAEQSEEIASLRAQLQQVRSEFDELRAQVRALTSK